MYSRWKPRLPSRSSIELEEERVAFRRRNEINVQGAGLELRHVELSHRCFSTAVLAFASRPTGNERKRRIAPCRDGQRKIGWTASRATERPFRRPCLRATGRSSVIRMYSQAERCIAARLLLGATEIASTHFPRTWPLFFSFSFTSLALSRNILSHISHIHAGSSSRFLSAARLHLTLQSCIKQTFALPRRPWRPGSISRTRTRMHYMCSGVWLCIR